METEGIEALAEKVGGNAAIVSSCLAMPDSSPEMLNDAELLIVLESFPRGVRFLKAKVGATNYRTIVVDKALFDKDIREAALGEITAVSILVPYMPLINPDFLHSQEIVLKRRIVLESIENLILEYNYLAHEILIQKKFFPHDALNRRAKIHPSFRWGTLNKLLKNDWKKNIEAMMQGFESACLDLMQTGEISAQGNLVKVSEPHVDKVLSKKFPVVNVLKLIERAIRTQVVHTYAGAFKLSDVTRELSRINPLYKQPETDRLELLDPRKFLTLPTSRGFVDLSNETSIERFAESEEAFGRKCVEMVKLGGVLNAVYRLEFIDKDSRIRVAAKKFEEWANFKWASLALWALGTQNFSVLAKTRLAREYSINRLLRRQKAPVPEVLHVSWEKLLLFFDYIDGEPLDLTLRRELRTGPISEKTSGLLQNAGKSLAAIHEIGITIGDCKPENMISTLDEKIFFVDLEQAGRGGNNIWDLAEFLYFCGHYCTRLTDTSTVEQTVQNFLQGYVDNGGDFEEIGSIVHPQYLKVFAPFILPQILLKFTRTITGFAKQPVAT